MGETAFGDLARWWSFDLLDAVRTATLLIGEGIRPGSRGPGASLRKVLHRVPQSIARAGVGRLVRDASSYWNQMARTHIVWPMTSQILEDEVLSQGLDHAP